MLKSVSITCFVYTTFFAHLHYARCVLCIYLYFIALKSLFYQFDNTVGWNLVNLFDTMKFLFRLKGCHWRAQTERMKTTTTTHFFSFFFLFLVRKFSIPFLFGNMHVQLNVIGLWGVSYATLALSGHTHSQQWHISFFLSNNSVLLFVWGSSIRTGAQSIPRETEVWPNALYNIYFAFENECSHKNSLDRFYPDAFSHTIRMHNRSRTYI